MKAQLEDIIRFVPYTKHKLVTPLLVEANYYETMYGYTREQVLKHFIDKYIPKPQELKSRYDITVRE